MNWGKIGQENDRGGQDIEDDHDDQIDVDCLLKEGVVTDEDITSLIKHIADTPEETKELLRILRKDEDLVDTVDAGNATDGVNADDTFDGGDAVDGAPSITTIQLNLPKSKCVTYKGLFDALYNSSFKKRDVLASYCLINKDLIPSSILERGRRSLAAYRRALKYGRTFDKRVKILMVGQNRAGKTSVARSLRGEPMNNDEPSTGGLVIDEPLTTKLDACEEPWKYSRRRSSAYARSCAEILRRESRGAAVENRSESTEELSEAFDQIDGNCVTSLAGSEDDEEGAIPNDITSILEDDPETDEEDVNNRIIPIIWELAGQAVDRSIHPIFMTSDAVYLVVFDASKNMFDKQANGCDSSFHDIMRCVDMVRSLKLSADDGVSPPVFLVGTRGDCVQDCFERKMKWLYQSPLISEHVEQLFAVDNTQAGQMSKTEDLEIIRLRKRILEVAKTMPHTKKEIPLHWLKIETTIEQKAREGKKFVSREYFKEEVVGKVCAIEESDVADEILHFLHDRGTIVYHDDRTDPDGLVFLDPQWLVNVIRQLLSVVPSQDDNMKVRKLRIQLEEQGILAAELLDHTCEKLGVNEIKQSLVFIMEQFNLLCPCYRMENQPTYLVPCMLSEVPENDIIPAAPDCDSPPVYLTFKTEFVPVGLFAKLVSLCRAWAASKSCCEQQIFANVACFILDDKNFLGLVSYKSVIKVQVWTQDDSYQAPECHLEVCSFLERSLSVIRDECQWLRSVFWELSIRCTLCGAKEDPMTELCIRHDTKGCTHADCAHYIPLKSRQYYCRHAKGPQKVMPEDAFYDWLRVAENNNIQQKTISPVQAVTDQFEQDKSKVQVTLLAGEWGSSKGGLPTVNRLLAIELAKHPNLEVTLYMPKCSEEDKRMANNCGINILKAVKRPGYDPLDWLGFCPPGGFWIDVVIGHGMKLGKQAQLIQQFFPNCVWIQFEHTAPEELAVYKKYCHNISIGEEKHKTEVQLGQMADLVVAVGPKLAEVFRTYLRPYPEKRVFEIVPSPIIFQEFSKCKQAKEDRKKFNVLVFGRGDEEDFELKGYDIAPKAIAALSDQRYHLFFVGAAKGEMEKVATRLLQHGIPERQLTVRGFIENREDLATQLCEVDLAIMPSRTEGFGLTALEALTAGLPILVGANSGFAEALKMLETDLASTCVVDSDDGNVWASAIRAVKKKPRSQRLKEVQILRERFEEEFNWSKQCRALSKEIIALVRGKRAFDKVICEQNRTDAAADANHDQKQYGSEEEEGNEEEPLPGAQAEKTEEQKELTRSEANSEGLRNEDGCKVEMAEHNASDVPDSHFGNESSDLRVEVNEQCRQIETLSAQEVSRKAVHGIRLRSFSETTDDKESDNAITRWRSWRKENHHIKSEGGWLFQGASAPWRKRKNAFQLAFLGLVLVFTSIMCFKFV